jgi:hypothetical protein
MTELAVVETVVEPFSRVEISPDSRTDYEDGRLTAVYPSETDEVEYVVALFNYDSKRATVEIPGESVVLDVSEGVVTALVPADAYGGGE